MRNWILTVAALTLAACSGQMTGQVQGTGERVVFNFKQGVDADTYSTQIGGEHFSGKAVMDGSTSTFGSIFGEGVDGALFGSTSTNRFVAVLLGDKGSTLNCQMRYADSSGFTTSGGVGQCKHSDGRVIDVVW